LGSDLLEKRLAPIESSKLRSSRQENLAPLMAEEMTLVRVEGRRASLSFTHVHNLTGFNLYSAFSLIPLPVIGIV